MRSLSALAIAGLSLLAAGGGAEARNDEFRALLRGNQEVPPVTTTTLGTAELNFTGDTLLVEITLLRARRVTQAHLHCAPRGSNGPVVAFLAGFQDRGWDVDGLWIDHQTLTNANILADATPAPTCPRRIRTLADLRAAMADGFIYANVHTVANPAGEVRGQAVRVD
jgi:hypothetical protein